MKAYRLTDLGKKAAKTPSMDRDVLLDHLYENTTASLDELVALDRDARVKLRGLVKSGLVEVVGGF